MGEQAVGTAEVGDLVHDFGAGDDEGWFIVGDGGYWDVDNACWNADEPGDSPWTSEHFQLFGSAADILRTPTTAAHPTPTTDRHEGVRVEEAQEESA